MKSSQTSTSTGLAASNPTGGGISSLPDVFEHRFFSAPEKWRDGKISKRIEANPIVDLCLRLATFDVAPSGQRCYDPKYHGPDTSLRGGRRLYHMIGKHVSQGTHKRMCVASERQWKFVEECWVANMHTVLLNQDFNPIKLDGRLFRAIQRYKRWFVTFAFSGCSRLVKRKDGTRKRVFCPANAELLLEGLKKLAGWLQWSVSTDMVEHNARPPPIPYWRGWVPQQNTLVLEWYGGHLHHFRDILSRLNHSDREITNLCQIRTFGRALPCPTKRMCKRAFAEQLRILTTAKQTPKEVLKVVSHFSSVVARRLNVGQMPTFTHVSVSTSGSFESSQEEGGLAGVVSAWVSELSVKLHDVTFSFDGKLVPFRNYLRASHGASIDIFDVYGERLFTRSKSYYSFYMIFPQEDNESSGDAEGYSPLLLDYLYEPLGAHSRREKAVEFLGDKALPNTIGKITLLCATAGAAEQGVFYSDKNSEILVKDYLLVGDLRIPIVVGIDNMSHHMLYRPVNMPKVRLDCLAEPGAKTRPLGKNQAWFTLVTRAMRFMAEPIISRDGRARIGLRSTNKMWSFLKFIKERGPEYSDPVAQSSDYKSATDLIPLDVLEAIWSGFTKSLRRSHPFWVFYKLITCNRELYKAPMFKDLEQEHPDGCLNLRGSFMGEPMSFLTLTLENLLVEEISDYYYNNPLEPLWGFPKMTGSAPADPSAICGDDVAALRDSLRRIVLFKTIATDIGWIFSWKDCVSRRVMIFCEDHALLSGKGKTFKCVYVDVIKSRLLTTMSREHSENRSSILGKGRMLGNQLDYFSDKNLKIACLSYFRNIFDRCYRYSVIRNSACKMPIYLPPCAGGIGIPIIDSLMPSFMWPYIGYIYKVLELPSEADRFVEMSLVSELNHRAKHGTSSSTELVIRKVFSEFKRASPGSKNIVSNVIYDDSFVIAFLEANEIKIPLDPYTGAFDFSSLENEAAQCGFIPLCNLRDEIERVLNFQKFIIGGVTKETRTFNKWLKDSKKFWRKRVNPSNRDQLASLGKCKFTSVASLEKLVTRAFKGWVYVGEDQRELSLINSGPSMKISMGYSSVTEPNQALTLGLEHWVL